MYPQNDKIGVLEVLETKLSSLSNRGGQTY